MRIFTEDCGSVPDQRDFAFDFHADDPQIVDVSAFSQCYTNVLQPCPQNAVDLTPGEPGVTTLRLEVTDRISGALVLQDAWQVDVGAP